MQILFTFKPTSGSTLFMTGTHKSRYDVAYTIWGSFLGNLLWLNDYDPFRDYLSSHITFIRKKFLTRSLLGLLLIYWIKTDITISATIILNATTKNINISNPIQPLPDKGRATPNLLHHPDRFKRAQKQIGEKGGGHWGPIPRPICSESGKLAQKQSVANFSDF